MRYKTGIRATCERAKPERARDRRVQERNAVQENGKRMETYLEVALKVLDDADQQLGLTNREGGVSGVRHDC